jgi:hypothetical protein
LLWLAVASLAFAVFWQWNYPVYVTWDSLEYIHAAESMAGQGDRYLAVHRTPGYPLLLLVTGVPFLHTFWITRVVQGLMAAAIPCLIFATLRPLSTRAASIVGWVTLASTIPFTYSTHIMTEQTSMFLFYLALFLVMRVLGGTAVPPWPWFIGLGAVGWLLALVRPANGLLFSVFVVVGLLFRGRWWRRWIAMVGLVFLFNALWVVVDRSFLGLGGVVSTYIDRHDHEAVSFARTYYSIVTRNITRKRYDQPILDATRGPAEKLLLEALLDYLRTKPKDWTALEPAALFGRHAAAPEELLRRIKTEPSSSYCAFVPIALRAQRGQAELRELVRRFAGEQGESPLKSIVRGLPFGVSSQMDGKVLFWQLYCPARFYGDGDQFSRGTLIRPENGPATRFLMDQILNYLRLYPYDWNTRGPAGSFDRFKDRPEDLVRNIFDHPDINYHTYLWMIMDDQLGPAASNELFKQAALEAVVAPLAQPLLFWDNFLSTLAGPGETLFNGGTRVVSLSRVQVHATEPYPDLHPRMNQEIAGRTTSWDLNRAPYAVVYLVRPLVVAGVFLLAVLALGGPWRAWFACGATIWMLQVLVASVFSSSHVRYTDYLVPLQCMLLAVGATAWKRARPPLGPVQDNSPKAAVVQ